MQPETSAQYQHRFAQAIREGKAADGLPQERLNVYIRLIRNNIHSFIDRCYTETLQYFDSEEWGRLKEGFVRDARAQTPYFQEIPRRVSPILPKPAAFRRPLGTDGL